MDNNPLIDSEEMKRVRYVASLREMADLFEAHKELPLPYTGDTFVYFSPDRLPAVVRALGNCEKRIDGDTVSLIRDFPAFKLWYHTARAGVCKRTQVGTRSVIRRIESKPAEFSYAESEEPLYEWKCPDSLLSGDQKEA